MKQLLRVAILILGWSGFGLAQDGIPPVLVVYNGTVADSIELARSYARAHGLPDERLCSLVVPAADMISRNVYEKAVEEVVGRCLLEKGLQDEVLYLVLVQGTPIWIHGDPGRVGDLASVDSELTLLYRKLVGSSVEVFGKVENPYFQLDPKGPTAPFRRVDHDIYLVTRLTGPDTEAVRGLISGGDPAEATTAAPPAVGFDLPSPGSSLLHDWVRTGATVLQQRGLSIRIDESAEAIGEAQRWNGFILVHPFQPTGPPAAAIPSALGSRAISLVLFETEETLRSPADWLTASRGAAFELIARGAKGTFFFVADPTLDGYPRPQIFLPAYFAGRNWAESAYAGTRYLSWRLVVVGDPLLRWTGEGADRASDARTVDPLTGFTEPFASRRRAFLVQQYQTTTKAANLLLQAERARLDQDQDAALEALRECLRADPRLVEAYVLEGELLEERGRWREAAAAYEAALERSDGFQPLVGERLVRLLVEQLHEPRRAEPYAARLVQERGIGDPEIARLWGRVLLDLERWEEAERVFLLWLKGMTVPPAFALQGLGEIAENRGNLAEARDFYTRALAAPGAQAEFLKARLEALAAKDAASEILEQAETPQRNEAVNARSGGETRNEMVLPRVVGGLPFDQVQVVPRKKGKLGRVVLRVFLDEHGQLLEVEPLSGAKSLYEDAAEVARSWRYQPRLVNGRPVPGWEELTIEFRRGED
ncbi:MAG: hypothetical protein Kow00109_26260 [Acidobacteriota bacterium]